MNKLFVGICATCVFLLLSCQKSTVSENVSVTVATGKHTAILDGLLPPRKKSKARSVTITKSELRLQLTGGRLNFIEYMDAYSQLTPQQQASLWQEKLTAALQQYEWSSEQASEIIKFRDLAKEEFFSTVLAEETHAAYMAELGQYFSEYAIDRVFCNLFDVEDIINYSRPNGASPNKNCNCRYSIGCGYGNYCDTGGCDETRRCGIMGGAKCTGLCDLPGMDTPPGGASLN